MTLALLDDLAKPALAGPTDTTTSQPAPLRLVQPLIPATDEDDSRSQEPGWREAVLSALIVAREEADRHSQSATMAARHAQAAWNAGEVDEARRAASKALALDVEKGDMAAAVVATQILVALGDLSAAEEALRSIALAGQASTLFARLAAARGEFRTALARLNGAEDYVTLSLRGWLHLQLGDFEDAIRWFRRAMRSALPTPDLLTNLGYAYGAVGSLTKAIRATTAATQLAPADRTAGFNLVAFHLAAGACDRAIRELSRLRQFHPNDLDIDFAVAEALMRSDKLEAAARELRRAKSEKRAWAASSVMRAELRSNLAFVDFRLGLHSRENAIRILQKELEATNYVSLGIIHLLAALFVHRRQASEVVALYDAALKLHREDELYDVSTRVAILRGDAALATDTAKRWVEKQPFSSVAATVATYLLTVQQSYDEAVRIGIPALRRYPRDIMLANNVAYALAMLKRPEQARRIIIPTPGSPAVTATMALIHLASGATERGMAGYETAEQLAFKEGDATLAVLIRLHSVLALAWFGHRSKLPEIEIPVGVEDDPRFLFLANAFSLLGIPAPYNGTATDDSGAT